MSDNEFVHLHVHSEFSLLDGMSRIKDLAKRAKELNQPALALTDHGTMHGIIDFYRACRSEGVKPILGVEGYLASRKHTDKDATLDRKRYHLLLLAHNRAGYLNLLHLSSVAQLDGFYYRPRIDRELLAQHSEGIITTTSCLAGEIPQAIMDGDKKKADKLMGWYKDVFGPDRFYVELQDHDIPEIKSVNTSLLELGKRHDVRFLATNDVHYTFPHEANPHDILLCIQTSTTLDDKKRMRMSDNGYYLKSYEEMHSLFGHVPGALSNSLLIAEMCDVDPEPPGYHLPNFEVPAGYDPHSYLRHLCERGLAHRYGAERAATDETLRRRLDRELTLINQMGFDTYFLIVWDLCEFARDADIWWNVRGSGAGSLVAYSLGITSIDPLENGLIFERFLNPDRVSMPDIDLDYPDDRRHEMLEYVVRKYGSDKVAQIITFGTLGARAAIRDVGRVMNRPLDEVNQLAGYITAIPGKPCTIDNALDKDHEFFSSDLKERYERDDEIQTLIDTAKQLEGLSRHASTHAAGVIISDKPLEEYCPLYRNTSGDESSEMAVTQWPMEVVESIGLLKVDFLGLSTLSVLRKAAELVEQRHGVKYDMDNIPYDAGMESVVDPEKEPEALFDLLGRGEVSGIFQVEGQGMRRLMMDMKPRRFDHIIAAISLYRPGPMENIPEYIRRMHADIYDGKDIVQYHHPDLEPILQDTYGIVVYQEQIIRIASDLAGYEPGEADMIRKAVAKKKEKLMREHQAKFTTGAMARGYSKEVCEAIWGDIEFFARYGFNKAHAADYAKITCQTAFLKAHYQVEYFTALLTVDRDRTEKVARYIADASRAGIKVLPPTINVAEVDFIIEGTSEEPIIRYGMGAIKNAGISAIEHVLQEREENGPFKDLIDLCDRVDLRKVGKRALESMIKVGVFDDWYTRPQMLDALERLLGYSGNTQDAKAVGQLSLFGGGSGGPATFAPQLISKEGHLKNPPDNKTQLGWEKELIGVYLSAHPLTEVMSKVEDWVNATTSQIDATAHDKGVKIVGLIASLRQLTTRKGDAMAFGQLEDLEGSIEVVFFPRTWLEVRDVVRPDSILFITGKVKNDSRGIKIVVESARATIDMPGEAGQESSSTRQNDKDKINGSGQHLLRERPRPHPRQTYKAEMIDKPFPAPADEAESSQDDNNLMANATSPPPPPNFDDGYFDDDPAYVSRENGGATKPNETKKQVAVASKPAPQEQYTILVKIKAERSWQETIRRSLQAASKYEGNDHIQLAVSGHNQVMEFPNLSTKACPELLTALRRMSGVVDVVSQPHLFPGP